MKKRPLHQRYQSTFFIFPVLLPLAEFIPWLLAAVGMTAGGVQFIKRSVWSSRRARIITIFITLSSFTAAGYLVAQRIIYTPSKEEGSALVPQAELSRLEQLAPADGITPPAPSGAFSLLWSATSPHQLIGKPAMLNNMLVAGTYQGTLNAFSAANGSHLWTLHKHEQIFPAPATDGTKAYVGEGHHTSPASVLSAFSLPEGKPVWERKFRSHIESSIVIDRANSRLFVSSGETGLWAIDSNTGKSLWHAPLGHIDITAAYHNKRLFTAAKLAEEHDGSAFIEVNPDTGATLASTPLPGNPMGSMLTDKDGNLCLATALGQVGVTRASDAGWAHCISPAGKLLWTTRLPALALPEGLMIAESNLLIYTLANGFITALDTRDGHVVWEVKAGDAFLTDATLIQGSVPLVATVSNEGIVTIRSALTGEEKRRFNVEQGAAYPLYSGKILYITTPYIIRAYNGVAD